ncbi:hypothetical protein AMECASPLE_022527, partial [Ameca splendens]
MEISLIRSLCGITAPIVHHGLHCRNNIVTDVLSRAHKISGTVDSEHSLYKLSVFSLWEREEGVSLWSSPRSMTQ